MSRNSNKNQSLLICLALMVVTTAVYYQVYSFEFVNFDDPVYISDNPNIQAGMTFEAVKWAFTAEYSANWHPITWLSHILDWQLFGSNPAGHHITNLIFHIANTLLLFIVLAQMTDALWPSAFVAALFALHPLHVESVAWVAERKDVLSTFFWLLTMWVYIRFVRQPKFWRYLLIVVFFALGLMSKPMLVTLPFVLLLLDYWPLERIGTKCSLIYLLIEKIPLFAMALASCIVTFVVQKKGGAMLPGENLSFPIRLANASISYLQYIIKMFRPARLAFIYPHPGPDISFLFAIISAFLLLAVTVIILWFSKSRRYLVTGWFWYLGTLVPVIGLVQVGAQAFSDRYSYITLTGLFIIIVWGASELFKKWPQRKIIPWLSAALVLAILIAITHFQLQYWKDTISLCQRALAVTKNNYLAHFLMTERLLEQGRIEEAIRHNTQAIRIKPDYADAYNGLGLSLYKAGRIEEAIENYTKAIALAPDMVEAYMNLGAALVAKGDLDKAVSFYESTLRLMPGLEEMRFFIGVALADRGRIEEVVKEYENFLQLEPQNAVGHNDFGVILFRQGEVGRAIEHFNRAIQIAPDFTIAKDNLDNVLAEKRRTTGKNTAK